MRQITGWIVCGLLCLAVFSAGPCMAESTNPCQIRQQADGVVLEHGDNALTLSLACPRFTLDDGVYPDAGVLPEKVSGALADGDTLRVVYPPVALPQGGALQVELLLDWSANEQVLRKHARYRVDGLPDGVTVKDITLDRLAADLLAAPPRFAPPQSYPVLLRGFFAGIEYPIAATRLEEDQVVLGHKPLHHIADGEWLESLVAVYGAAPAGQEKQAFQRYIQAHRPEPRGQHFNYNSWWTSPVPFSEQDILGLMRTFEEQLYQKHGVALDSFTIDMGWSNPKSIWEIDAKLFPEGFTRIQAGARQMGSQLGLWTSPSSCYPPAIDPAWAREAGYESFAPYEGATPLLSLGGARYGGAVARQLSDMAGRFSLKQIKLDGYCLGGADYMAGPFSAEDTIAGGLRAFAAIRKASPDVWLEATFSANASPWWLFHLNSVIGSFGDDAPFGRVPCPVGRESYTTARDFYNLMGAVWLASPIVAQEVLGVIHQSDECFMNDALTTVLRGHAFIPLYVNPKYMNDRRWDALARLMRWARAHAEELTAWDTEPLVPTAWADGKTPWFDHAAPMPRTPYGYAHWRPGGGEGWVLLRNPWIAPQSYPLTLPGAGTADVVSVYPEPRTYAAGQPAGQALSISLAPYETVLLHVIQAGSGALPRAAAECLGQPVHVASCDIKTRGIQMAEGGEAFGPDWTLDTGLSPNMAETSIKAVVETTAPNTRLLLLFENDKTIPEAAGSLQVNGVETPLTVLRCDSAFSATGAPRPENWTFLAADLPQGRLDLDLICTTAAGPCTLSAWLWAARPGDPLPADAALLPSPESLSLGCVTLMPPTALGDLPVTENRTASKTHIQGVWLDTLDPVSVTQGWGKLQRNQSVWEKPLTIGKVRYRRGLGTHAPSRIVYQAPSGMAVLEAFAGPDSATQGTLAFEVWLDGVRVWESGFMGPQAAPKPLRIDLNNAKELALVVTDGGNGNGADHADWADAKLLRTP